MGAVLVAAAEVWRLLQRANCAPDPTAHAEILPCAKLPRASTTIAWEGATLYVTLEPCVMCAGAC